MLWVFVAECGLSLVAASGGYSSLQCTGFSLQWLPLSQSTGSRHAGLSSCGARAQQFWRTGLLAPRHVGSSRTRVRTCVLCTSRQWFPITAPPGKFQRRQFIARQMGLETAFQRELGKGAPPQGCLHDLLGVGVRNTSPSLCDQALGWVGQRGPRPGPGHLGPITSVTQGWARVSGEAELGHQPFPLRSAESNGPGNSCNHLPSAAPSSSQRPRGNKRLLSHNPLTHSV